MGRARTGRPRGKRQPATCCQSTHPTAAPPRPQEPAPAYHLVYRIRRGDTLSAIAWRFYGDPAALASLVQANPGVEPRALRIGTPLRLPLPPAGTPAPLNLERIVP